MKRKKIMIFLRWYLLYKCAITINCLFFLFSSFLTAIQLRVSYIYLILYLTNNTIHTMFHILSFLIHFNPEVKFWFQIRKKNDISETTHQFMPSFMKNWNCPGILWFNSNTVFKLSINLIHFSNYYTHSDLSSGISE